MSEPRGYNDGLSPGAQIQMEEDIASYLFDLGGLDEEDCANAGRAILLMVLAVFRSDLMA